MKPAARGELLERLSQALVAATLLLPPFILWPTLHEPFRLPKLLASELLGLLSVLVLVGRLRQVERVQLSSLWRLGALRAVAPLLLVATVGALATAHPAHVREALWSLWVAAACMVAWSGLGARLRRLLDLLLVPAAALSLLAVLQYHALFRPLAFVGGHEVTRLGLTALAGSVGDLSAYLVLPCLLAQVGVGRLLLERWQARALSPRAGRGRPLRSGGVRLLLYVLSLLALVYGLAISQTQAALVAVSAATFVLWTAAIPGRRRLLVPVVGALLMGAIFAAVPPIRERVYDTITDLRQGKLDHALTGRLDGWKAAMWMLEQRPLTGVGLGAYGAEFIPAKLALLDRGVQFFPRFAPTSTFGNAHNEFLEVAAELGGPGVLALLLGLAALVGCCFSRQRRAVAGGDRLEAALAWSALVALASLALVYFPFRLALTGYPAIAVLAWIAGDDQQQRQPAG